MKFAGSVVLLYRFEFVCGMKTTTKRGSLTYNKSDLPSRIDVTRPCSRRACQFPTISCCSVTANRTRPCLPTKPALRTDVTSRPETVAICFFRLSRQGSALSVPRLGSHTPHAYFLAWRHKKREVARCGLDLHEVWLEHL